MAILAFILIAHEPAVVVGKSIDMFLETDSDCLVVVHYDRNSPAAEFAEIRRRYGRHDRVLLVEERARCAWGQFGLVDGTVRALRRLADSGRSYTHAYLASCSCWPIRPLAELRQFLDFNRDIDFIESHDETWMTGGLREERYTLRHPFSFTQQRWLFEASVRIQRKLGLKRKIPHELKPLYGSQWWCLRHETVGRLLGWIDDNPGAYRFYRQVWIPDETFFQTLLGALGGTKSSGGYIPTLYRFNASGKPIVFYDDHLAWLLEQPHFFARKVAQSATHCRAALLARARSPLPSENPIVAVPEVSRGRGVPGTKQRPRYGQIFEPNSGVRDWRKNLETMNRICVVLYGPPQLTRLAGDVLDAAGGLTVLGRLFQPGKIELQSELHMFGGLQSDGIRLRDYDRALYLSRVLARCEHLPVFELCPGDDPVLERSALDRDMILTIPLLPGGTHPAWRHLFWYLALPEPLRSRLDGEEGRFDRLKRVEEITAEHFGQKYMAAMEKRLFGPARQSILTLSSGVSEPIDSVGKEALRFLHGAQVEPLLQAVDKVAAALGRQDWRALAPDLVEETGDLVGRHG